MADSGKRIPSGKRGGRPKGRRYEGVEGFLAYTIVLLADFLRVVVAGHGAVRSESG
jgi:hypothetical protein